MSFVKIQRPDGLNGIFFSRHSETRSKVKDYATRWDIDKETKLVLLVTNGLTFCICDGELFENEMTRGD